ncbi:flavodoxin family protein [Senegalia massiliensis]|uniref:Flavodoxin family protein n=1 Tax=Senegalia massiliensis TaxID=1720316 RepID=A0A845R115_9CLOT|nr:flavodoxin family protein [Senegalia massiliensis]NBI07188.1 flavodoxin family protein [Senegalia massiliensis]
MKIVSISGSPRKNGNTANILNTIQKCISKTHEMDILYLTDYNINGCLGCSQCQRIFDKIGCVQKDDTIMLLNHLIKADIILYGTPLYGHSYSGQLKVFMDRHVALFKFVCGENKSVDKMKVLSFLENKPVGLIVSCQGPQNNNTELIKTQFEKFCESSLATCLGKYVFPFCDAHSNNTEYAKETLTTIIEDIEKNFQKNN